MIEVQHIYKSFGKKQILRDITVQFESGLLYGIVGENGAGKSTFFRCLAELEAYDGIVKSHPAPLQAHLGFLFTEPFFFPKITGLEYIRLLCLARHINPDDVESRNIFDLPLNQYAATYSTGMKKKLALTALLLQDNEFYILDEPFNGVDIQSNILITEIILKLKSLGKTVLIASHIFSTLRDTCDVIYVLKNGSLSPPVFKESFHSLEEEMKKTTVAGKIEKLGLA